MSELRKNRVTITAEKLRAARDLLDRGKETKEIGELLGISISAARTLCIKIANGTSDSEILCKKGRKSLDNSAVKSLISSTLIQENSLTQKGISERLGDFGVVKSQPYISRMLKKMEFTRKRLSLVPSERNSPRIIESRQNYARSIRDIPLDKLIYLDETGFNLHTTQNFGYSPKNEKAYVTVPASRGQNNSLMCAISVIGIIAHELIDGSYNGDSFKDFIRNYLLPYFLLNPGSILIMDNCRFHHRLDVLGLLTENRIAFKFLPAYSPQLNPIEEFFGELKANYRAIHPLSRTRDEIKERVRSLITARVDGFLPGYEKSQRMLQNALTRQPFI